MKQTEERKEAALALALCYTTGARMCEVLGLQFEDCRITKDSGNRFFEAHIRCSKTDPFCLRKETLTLPLSVKHAVPVAEEIERLCQKQQKGKSQKKTRNRNNKVFQVPSSKSWKAKRKPFQNICDARGKEVT